MDVKAIQDSTFVKQLNYQELEQLAYDIRQFLIKNVSKTGGHLSSNLGVVELTIALHYVFNPPVDKFIFDVGHQSYTHKILTGRASQFKTLRKFGGLSGFQKRSESPYDAYEAGHSSTALSAAVGMAMARDLNHQKHQIIPIVGDAAMVGGASLEALNHLGFTSSKVIIILNDNQMSISKNVGGVNDFLSNLRTSMAYNKAKQDYKEMLTHIPFGKPIYKFSKAVKDRIRNNLIDETIFSEFGVDYLGPIDGHDYNDLIRALNKAKNSNNSIVVHVLTKKGKGYSFAENDSQGKWHGVSPFRVETGEPIKQIKENYKTWSEIVASQVYKAMAFDQNIVAITPAMISGSKMENIFRDFPDRSFDVGIAEQHATTFACGLSVAGKKPFISMYSSFLQRAYDQINHDVGRMNLPMLISVDRAGFVGEDGETHHGVFDIGFLMAIPNLVIFTPSCASEARRYINTAFLNNDHPYVIRVSKQTTLDQDVLINDTIEIGTWQKVHECQSNIVIITYDDKVNKVFSKIKENNINVDLINARFLKPMDTTMLDEIAQKYEHIIVYETDLENASLGLYINQYYTKQNKHLHIINMAVADHYTPQGTIDELLHLEHLDMEELLKVIDEVSK